jgi:hypothetical protein
MQCRDIANPRLPVKSHLSIRASLAALLLGLAVGWHPVIAVAGDHADAPLFAHDPSADIADLFAFLDPTDNSQVVLIATVHPHIVPGLNPTVGSFDENIRYRFEIYNDHINLASPVLNDAEKLSIKRAYAARVKPKLLIDVTFSKRAVGLDPQANPAGSPLANVPANLRRPTLQAASLNFQGFKNSAGAALVNRGKYPVTGAPPLTVTASNVGPTAPNFTVHDIEVAPGAIVRFFAGLVDDPYFFDLPGFTAYLDSIRIGTPSSASYSRARDTFAGYNVLAIALRIPKVLLVGPGGTTIGVDFLTQRHGIERHTTKGFKAGGAFATVDRMGHPHVASVLIPFDLRDLYNVASPKADVSLKFADEIFETLSNFNLDTNPPETAVGLMADLFIAKGDLLQLDTAVPNTGTNPEARYPNGRRLQDDTVDIFLTLLNGLSALGDNVNAASANAATNLTATFPFLGKPNQPLYNPANAAEDYTRN